MSIKFNQQVTTPRNSDLISLQPKQHLSENRMQSSASHTNFAFNDNDKNKLISQEIVSEGEAD